MLKTTKYLLLAFITFQCVYTEDDIISQLFPENKTSTHQTTSNYFLLLTDLEDNECYCVPYYMCNENKTIISNSTELANLNITKGPCEHYLESCCKKEDRLKKPISTPPSIVPVPKGCGFRNPEGVGFRITGDNDNEAEFGEFPWMVAILREEQVEGTSSKLSVYQCGGTLIQPNVVLTAAHCVFGKHLHAVYKIRAGEWDIERKNEIFDHQDRVVKNIITHPDYRNGSLYNDIALLFLEEPVDMLQDNVGLICIPPAQYNSNDEECFSSGWGKDVSGENHAILQKIQLPIVDHAKCEELLRTTTLGKDYKLHTSFICSGKTSGKTIFEDNSGSPIVCPMPNNPGHYHQYGIISWRGNYTDKMLGVNTNVAVFRDWIDAQMANHNLKFK